MKTKIKLLEIEAVKEMIRSTSLETGVYVGCDAQIKGGITSFATVVVIHFDCKHGATVFGKRETVNRRMSLRDKLWHEVILATNVAMGIQPAIASRPFSVHLDLNPDPAEKSHVIVKEACAYVRGLQFTPVIKPFAFAASHVADKICKS